MAINTVYALHGVVNASTFLSQISNFRVTPDIEVMIAQSAGLPYPLFTGNMRTNPGVTFDCTQVATILGLSGALSSIVDLSGSNTDLFFKQIADRGRRVSDASSAHIRFRMSQAFLSLGTITAAHNGEASAAVRVGTTYDGTNAPLQPAGSQALTGTPSSAEHFKAGPVVVNSVALPGVENITIDFGRQILEMGGDGEQYNTFAACQFYAPTITIRCTEHPWATYGLNGTLLTALSVYLRAYNATGNIADATPSHIKFTATTGLVTVDESSGGANDPSMSTVRITLASANAAAEPIAVTVGSAIT